MVSKSNHFHEMSELHKKLSNGYKKLAKASESGIEYEYTPKLGKSVSLKKR